VQIVTCSVQIVTCSVQIVTRSVKISTRSVKIVIRSVKISTRSVQIVTPQCESFHLQRAKLRFSEQNPAFPTETSVLSVFGRAGHGPCRRSRHDWRG
jgi:hypothetical protein